MTTDNLAAALRELCALWDKQAEQNESESSRLAHLPVANELARDGAQYRQSASQIRNILAAHAAREGERAEPLYEAVNYLLAELGANGTVTSRHPTVVAVMDALRAIDGGRFHASQPRPEQGAQAQPSADVLMTFVREVSIGAYKPKELQNRAKDLLAAPQPAQGCNRNCDCVGECKMGLEL